ncbi:lytic polysaccharide monooxygenase [Pseudoalteromonas mariniglutinosa]|uniref:lytic polysaccharide monooxygenase n=1 Tax=Pseudoalteromonas mariniglutinosa TaxID=206042 RepID=UPI00384C0B0F
MRSMKTPLLSLSILASSVLLASLSSSVNAHGYMDSPKARQAFCQADGGYWWPADGSNIANLACRAAFLESGHVQFIQQHEFSANTPDYLNQAAVAASVPDGTLCAAGDNEKRGMNLASPHWQRSEVVPNSQGDIQVRFLATTPHNPSFWQFYLTKPSYDGATQPLSWADLDLLEEYGNVDFVKDVNGERYYEMSVSLPAERTGDAILYTRWQRDDVVGEGFYNCSDITIVNDTGPSEPSQWQSVAYFIRQGQDVVVGDSVTVRLFDGNGHELITQQRQISTANQSDWASALAAELSENYAHLVQVGVQNTAGEIVFSQQDLLTNQVFTTNTNYSFVLTVQAAPSNTAPIIHQPDDITVDENSTTAVHLHAFDDQQSTLSYQWHVPEPLSFTGNDANIEITAPAVTEDSPYTIDVVVSDGELSSQVSFVFTVTASSEDDPEPSVPAWQSDAVYDTGDQVSFQGDIYTAKWWNQAQQPDSSDAWQLETSNNIQWHSDKAYSGGDEVTYQGQRYRAKWWSQGDIPGDAQVWTLI